MQFFWMDATEPSRESAKKMLAYHLATHWLACLMFFFYPVKFCRYILTGHCWFLARDFFSYLKKNLVRKSQAISG
jgi:hypothetical protein